MNQNFENQVGLENKTWWARNKKKVAAVCGVAGLLIVGCLLYRNREAIAALGKGILGKNKVLSAKTPQRKGPLVTGDSFAKVAVNCKSPVGTESPIKLLPEIRKEINGGEEFRVTGHIRKLPPTRKSSPEARANAREVGIHLGPHETFVRDYVKNRRLSEAQEILMEA